MLNPPGASSTTKNQDPKAVHHQDANTDLDDDSFDENDGHATTIRRSLSIHGDSPAQDVHVDDELLDDDDLVEPHRQR